MESIIIEAIIKGNINKIHIKDAFNVSKLHANLLSVSKIISNGLKIQINLNKCIKKYCDGEAIMITPRKDILYEIIFFKMHKVDATNLMQSPVGDDALELYHRHLGYLNVKGIYKLQNMVSGVNYGNFFLS